MAVLLLQIVVQITTWSLRDYVTLQRYFTICLPPLIVASAIFGALAFGKRHAKFTLPAAASLAFYFSLFWKPSNFEGLPAEVRNELIAQPAHLNRNFETNLGFVEIMRNLRSAAQKVDRWARPDSVIAVPPWFEGYIAGSQHGLVGTERKIVTSSAPEWAHYREADYLIAYDVNGGKFPDNGPEGTDGDLELIQSKRGVTGTFAVYVNRSRNPRRADR
ncbi:hypothetical protein IT570_02420 [Candidatus Sumerlaeota bacterium]|nr:hypothetical protein [Candidatus Sumerlaeota bacterium]